MSTYFVTGGYGFLGAYLLRSLAEKKHKIYALIRPQSHSKINEVLQHLDIEWVEGDILNPLIFSDVKILHKLTKEVTHIIHAAALYDLDASYDNLYLANVVGTHNVIHFAGSISTLKEFHHVSTMAVAGDYRGQFSEDMFDEGQAFPDRYASTKFLSESAVREWKTEAKRAVYRLGIVVGESKSGFIPKVDGPYYLMRALSRISRYNTLVNRLGFFPLPFNELTRIYMVPVDVAADAIVRMTEEVDLGEGLHVFHVMGQREGIPVRAVLRSILRTFGFNGRILALSSNHVLPRLIPHLKIPAETLFYMNSLCKFSIRNTQEKLPGFSFPDFEEYAENLFVYAKNHLFRGKNG